MPTRARPLRRWKRYLHQGGMSDPCIVSWPKGIAARGEIRGQYIHAIDIMPTLLDALEHCANEDFASKRRQRKRTLTFVAIAAVVSAIVSRSFSSSYA